MTQHQQKVADAQRRRLEVLEVQAAELGSGTPPQIRTEIEDLQRALAGEIADVEPISEEERYRATMRAVMLLSQQLAAVEVKVGRLYWVLPLLLFLYLFVSFVLDRL
ncbi:MAG: hypothetical protein IPO81_00060 [Kouleothrix sp.]|nr:hypothetical protein [Kouleothrix sp.]